MNDRLLRVTMILTVFVLVGAVAAIGAAAAQDFNVTDPDPGFEDTIFVGDNIQYDATVNNSGADGTRFVNVTLNNGTDVASDSQLVELNTTESKTVTLDPDTTGLAKDVYDVNITGGTSPPGNSVEGTLFIREQGENVVISGEVTDLVNQANIDTNTVERFEVTVVEANTGQTLIQDVPFSDFGTLASVNNDVDTANFIPGQPDEYVLELSTPNGANNPNQYEFTVTDPLGEFETFDGISEELIAGQNDDQNVRLRRVALPDRFDIDQSAESALGDGEDSILFNVSILGNLEGNALENEPFTVFHDGGAAVNIANGASFTTGSNGFVEFEVTSNISQRVNFEFVADNLDENANEVVEIRQKSFVLQGEGTVIGDVWDTDDGDLRSLEDARIWTFQKEIFTSQSIRVPPNESSTTGFNETAFVNEGQDSFFRLVKSEDDSTTTPSNDTVLDVTQDYRIDNDGQNENLSISRVRELNTSDSSVGSGWAVEANVDDPFSVNVTDTPIGTGMYVTPLDSSPEAFYYVQKSDNVLNASDQRFVDETAPNDPFPAKGSGFVYEISGTSQFADNRNVTPNQPTQDIVRRAGNLTFEAAKEFSSFSGQKLFDTTDENGEYVLDDMFTDFQAGIDYTIIANKAGYEVEFVDAFVAENGALFENGEDENFAMREVEQDTDVNITNIAQLPENDPGLLVGDANDTDAYDPFEFADKSDQTSQVIPRDGEAVDVVLLETFIDGTDQPAPETVELSIPDIRNGDDPDALNFTGEWIQVAGGTVESGLNTDTITVTTGADGQAILWLQSDLSIDSLTGVPTFNANNDGLVCGFEETFVEEGGELTRTGPRDVFEGIVAQSTTDAGAIDTSCKDFRGVNIFEAGSISGTVRNNDQGLPETVVWTREFVDSQGNLFTITPVDGRDGLADAGDTGGDSAVGDEVFDFSFYQRTGAQVPNPDTTAPTTTAQFNATELRDFNAQQFGPLATPPGFSQTFNLLRFPSDDPENLGDYSMDRVPAQDATLPSFTNNRGVDYQRIQAVQYETNATGNGTSSNPVRTGFTEEGDVVIPVEPRGVIVSPDFQLEGLSPDPATVTEGSGTIDISVDVNNTGLLSGTQDLELTIENSSTGNVVESDTISGVSVAAGDTQTETFTGVPAGSLPPGDYNHIISSDDDSIEGDLTVQQASSGPLFTDPLLSSFNNPPQNISTANGGFDDALYEDLDGDGDPTDLDPTVDVFSALIRGDDLNGDANDGSLTDAQEDALDWDGDGDLDVDDTVELFGDQIR